MSIWILSKKDANEYENKRLLEEFEKNNLNAKLISPDKIDLVVNKNIRQGIHYNGSPTDLPKICLSRVGSGSNKFIQAIMRQLEHAGIPCINKSTTIETVKDKLLTSQILSHHGIPIPDTMLVKFPVDEKIVKTEIGFPCVVKVITGSHGNGIYLCEKRKNFSKLMNFISSLDSSKTLLVQEYLGDQPGVDLRVIVVGGKIIGAMKRIAPEGDFRANISNGGHGEPFPLTDEIEYIALETASVLNLDIAGIDLLFDKNGFRVCEANSNPGFAGFEKYCNINVAEAIAKYLAFKYNLDNLANSNWI
jgi:gamma-F420-2:alpha-L-glutamate ligase